jgi:Sap, sulfolipid-1-addressing protein
MSDVLLLAIVSALSPTLLAVTTLMLVLPHPRRLMLGYWVGAMLTSVTLGLVIVFTLRSSSVVSTTKRTLSPIADLALSALFLIIAVVVATGRDRRVRERRADRRVTDEAPRWHRAVSKGRVSTAFVTGALLTLPGTSYLIALSRIGKLDFSNAVTVLVVVAFNLVQLVLIEAPLLAFAVAPRSTPVAIERGKAWTRVHGRTYAAAGLGVLGACLAVKGIVGLLAA